MAQEQDIERELPASQKRLDEARESGQIPRSRELTTAALLLAGAAALMAAGPMLVRQTAEFVHNGLTVSRLSAFDTKIALGQAGLMGGQGLLVALPVLGALFAAALFAPLAVGGWVFSTDAIKVDFARLNPLKGLANLLSAHSATELGKAVAKVALIGGVLGWLIWRDQVAFVAPLGQAPGVALAAAGHIVLQDFLIMAALLLLIAAADVPLQIWQHGRGLRMSAEELKREARETEGDPKIKGKIRARQREAARRRMMSAVPKADVVVTNPTHYAVALSYQGASMRAPKVVAKGADVVAARIREIAAAHGVPLLEAPPLARALYAHAELEAEIPAALYNAVAQVLAYVFQLRTMVRGRPPAVPAHIPVPPELDPHDPASTAGAAA